MAVPGRTVDRDPGVHQPLAEFKNIFHFVGEVTEISPPGIGFGIPIPGEFHLGIGIVLGTEENQAESAGFDVDAPDLFEPELVAVEVEGGVEIGHPDHRMEKSHPPSVGKFSGRC